MTHAYFRGPLPPPAMLEAFERAHPGAAERIFTLAEEQIRARHAMEAAVVRGAITSEVRGQWMAFLTVVLGMALGSWLVVAGHDTYGLFTMLTPLGTVAALFLHSRGLQRAERELKRLELERARVTQPI